MWIIFLKLVRWLESITLNKYAKNKNHEVIKYFFTALYNQCTDVLSGILFSNLTERNWDKWNVTYVDKFPKMSKCLFQSKYSIIWHYSVNYNIGQS